MQSPNLTDLELKDYVRIAVRHKVLFIAVLAATIAATIFFTNRQTPMYTASVDVMIELEPRTDAITGANGTPLDSNRLLENEVGFLESQTVVLAVTEELGLEPDVTVSPSGNRDFITLSAIATEPETAAIVANTYAQTYLDLRRESAIADLFETSNVVRTQVEQLDGQIATIDASMDAEVAQLEAAAAPQSLDGESAEIDPVVLREIERRYDEQRQPLVSQRSIYAQYLTTVQLNADLTSGAVGRIVSPAETPLEPSSPRRTYNIALSTALGLLLAAGATLLRHSLHDVVTDTRTSDGLGGTPLLASIPTFARRQGADLVSLKNPDSASAEAFRSLRTAVVFAAIADEQRVIQVTSPAMSEGKSETAANLAVSLAQAGHSAVLLDADLRRPTIATKLGFDHNAPGLSSVLAQAERLTDCLIPLADVGQLMVLPSGPMPEDPAAFVGTRELERLLVYLRKHFDFVIVDTPPVGLVSDPLTISRLVDAVIIVARSEKTRRLDLNDAVSKLRQVDAPILGTVLNGTRRGRSYNTYYGDKKRSRSRQLLNLEAPRLRDIPGARPAARLPVGKDA